MIDHWFAYRAGQGSIYGICDRFFSVYVVRLVFDFTSISFCIVLYRVFEICEIFAGWMFWCCICDVVYFELQNLGFFHNEIGKVKNDDEDKNLIQKIIKNVQFSNVHRLLNFDLKLGGYTCMNYERSLMLLS